MIAKTTKIASVASLSAHRPLLPNIVPDVAYIAVQNGRCATADVSVKEGDHVYLCQVIGLRHGPFFDQPIHATVSGTVLGIEKHGHRSGKVVDYIMIQNDHKDEIDPSLKVRDDKEIAAMSREEMIECVKNATCIGLGGSGFPTFVKLNTKEKIEHILVNGIECEPYLDSDQLYMEHDAEDMLRGTALLQQMFGVKDARICIKDIHPELIAHVQEVIDRDFPDSGITVCPMKNFYPQGWEVAMVHNALGIDVPPGKIPPQVGVMNVNAASAGAIYYAIKYSRPILDRYVSINGDGVNEPCDALVRIGTPFSALIEAAKGYKGKEPKTFLCGGPMMGASLENDDCITTKAVTSLMILNEKSLREAPCIHCGSCVLSCPRHLQPVLIMEAVVSGNGEMVKALHPMDCMECGLCTYSCTSGIRVTDYVRKAKGIVRNMK